MSNSIKQAIVIPLPVYDKSKLTESLALFNPDGTSYPNNISAPEGGYIRLTAISDVAPEDPSLGDIWFNTNDGNFYVWFGDDPDWLELNIPNLNLKREITIITKTTDYTLGALDAGCLIEMDKASAVTLTIPSNASVSFDVGCLFEILAVGTGQVTISAEEGVTVHSTNGMLLTGQWSAATLIQRAVDEWVLTGDLTS